MKKIGLIMIALFSSIAISLSAQTDTYSDQQDSVTVQTLDVTAETDKSDASIDKLIEKAISAKIEDLDFESDQTNTTGFVGTVAFLVIVLPILITFAAVVLIVFFVLRHKKGREKARYDLYMKSLEAGQQLPDKFFEEPKKSSSNLKKGAIWLAVGVGLVFFGLAVAENALMGIGAVPAFIGVAYLLVFFIEKRDNKDTVAFNE